MFARVGDVGEGRTGEAEGIGERDGEEGMEVGLGRVGGGGTVGGEGGREVGGQGEEGGEG